MDEEQAKAKTLECYSKNMEAIQEVNPLLAQHLQMVELDHYGIMFNRDGLPIPVQQPDGNKKILSPVENTLRLAWSVAQQMWSQIYKVEQEGRQKRGFLNYPVLLGGVGCPYTLDCFIRTQVAIVLNMKRAILLVEEDTARIRSVLHCVDLSGSLIRGELRIFDGPKALILFKQYLLDTPRSLVPCFPVILKQTALKNELNEILNTVDRFRAMQRLVKKRSLDAFHGAIEPKNRAGILRRQDGKPPKILVLTCRYTTFLQHCCRNLMRGLKACGADVELAIEESDTQTMTPDALLDHLTNARPDLVVTIDYRRAELISVPLGLPFVCWIQDEMPHLMAEDAGLRVSSQELVLAAFPNLMPRLEGLGYPRKQLRFLAIPTDPELFRPVELTDEQRKKYGARFAYAAHQSISSEQGLATLMKTEAKLKRFFLNCYDLALERLEKGNPLSKDEITAEFEKKPESLPYLSDFILYVCRPLGQELPLNWLIESGERDLKIFGKGWEMNQRFSRFAAGEAKYGEELNIIQNATDINLTLHYWSTVHQRFFDCAASGAFQLVTGLPSSMDAIEKLAGPDVPVVTYTGKNDFLEKINRYRNNPAERRENSESLRAYVINNFTYKRAAEQILGWMADYLES